MTPYANANSQYLVQRVLGASPQQLMAILLEGGQRFLTRGVEATKRGDIAGKAHFTNKALAIVEELTLRLNHQEGGELVNHLLGVHDWWTREILAASATKDAVRLERVSRQMGEIRQAWEQLDQKRGTSVDAAAFQVRDMVG
jgi:flagellar biosynthetic protein FliS